MMGVIFDLDQTLIDSSMALQYRRDRNWAQVYKLINEFQVYAGINEIINILQNNDIPICIVTSSPKSYCEKVLEHCNFSNIRMVCYHDTKKHKPNSEPIDKAVTLLNCDKSEIISIGDDISDIVASKNAGVTSILATWGMNSNYCADTIKPDYTFNNCEDLKKYIIKKFQINKKL